MWIFELISADPIDGPHLEAICKEFADFLAWGGLAFFDAGSAIWVIGPPTVEITGDEAGFVGTLASVSNREDEVGYHRRWQVSLTSWSTFWICTLVGGVGGNGRRFESLALNLACL
jgi:hypothetical protein